MPTITTRKTTDLEYLLDVAKKQEHVIEAAYAGLEELNRTIALMGDLIQEPVRDHLTEMIDDLTLYIEENSPGV